MSRQLEQQLRTLPDVYAALEDALHGTATGTKGERVTGGGGDSRPAPLQLQVAEHRHQLLRGLRYWHRRLRDDTRTVDLVGEDLDSVAAMSAWLLAYSPAASESARSELQDNLEDWHRKAHALTDLPQLRGSLPLGDCLNSSELWSCPGALYAMLPADPRRAVWLSCRDCGGRWDVTELPDAANVLLPVHQAAELLDVSVRTIQRRTERADGMVRLGDAMRTEYAMSR